MTSNRMSEPTKDTLLAAGGVLGAVGAASCCVLPLAFGVAGVGGVWISTLTGLAPYQPIFLVVAAVCIGFGLWRAHGYSRPACDEGECATAASRRTTKVALWGAAVLLLMAGSAEWWARLLA